MVPHVQRIDLPSFALLLVSGAYADDGFTNVECYCSVDAWNSVAVGPDIFNSETPALIFHLFVVMSNNHLCNVMILGDDCRVLNEVRKRRLAKPSSHPEDAILVEKSIKRV